MIDLYKKRGETPLQALARLREEKPELQKETLSYAGRLDPMAEGILSILVGTEENKNRKEFLEKDKEYEAHFLIGCATDTYDILGLVTKTDFKKIPTDQLESVLASFTNIKEQVYPWYSSKTVNGIQLFEYARAGNFDIERPSRSVNIYSVSDIAVQEVDGKELVEQNIQDIKSIVGDFRQEESINLWNTVLDHVPDTIQIASCTLKVSSGTYIRSLTEDIERAIGVPVVLQKLVRTRVG
jgi:tRNA pseudouridine(55) synthase